MRFITAGLLAAVSLSLLPAPARADDAPQNLCGHMLEPAVSLREISRGFSSYHSGIDLMAPYGSPIRAAADGTVIYTGRYYAYGNIVDIRHENGIVTRYAHMSAFEPGVGPGTPVKAGDVIGRIGTSGHAHGAHVHFEVRINGRAVNPAPYLALAACTTSPQTEPLEEAMAPDEHPLSVHKVRKKARGSAPGPR